MVVATLILSAPEWLWPALAALAVGVATLWWSYRVTTSSGVRWGCSLLKAIGISLLAFCLLEPLWSRQRVRPRANLFAVVADNSQGLQLKDAGSEQSRGEELKDLLQSDKAGWLAALDDDFEVRRFQFDSRLAAVRDFSGLDFEGRASSLRGALRGIQRRLEGRPLAGILLFTDGNATDMTAATEDLEGLPPVYPVVVGQTGAAQDVAIVNTHVTQTAFEDAPVTVQVDVDASGLKGERVRALLKDAEGERVRELIQRVRKDEERLVYRFQFRPEKDTLSFYRVEVGLQGELGAGGVAEASREATRLNNQRVVVVDRGGGPYRVLYVSGRPNWEYKFLNRALSEDDQLELVGLIRIAHREPKFEFRGRAGETSNPLFRGFGDQSPEEVERYDRPVLTRLNTRDEVELSGGFPATAEELYGYHAVILDDLEAGFFTADQALLLQRFVAERGGGLLMLGGMESFREGGYPRTSIGDMLPVYLDRSVAAVSGKTYQLNLAREGWLQPWARLRDTESAEKKRLASMPPFRVLNPVQAIKPGASVIATVASGQDERRPALVTQRFGRGRTAALLVGDVWRWGMRNPAAREDMNKAWRQWVRWLVADVPEPVELTVENSPETAAGAVELQVRVRDREFKPMDEATVIIEVTPSSTTVTNTGLKPVRLRPEAAAGEPGLFASTYVPRQAGGYRARAFVTNSVGAEVGLAEAGWSTDLAADEFKSLQPNITLLEDIARRTGGELVRTGNLRELARRLPHEAAPVMEAWTTPAWHTPWLFTFAVGCFVAEWGIRRWRGLP